MGRLDQYAKDIFAAETPAVTHGAAIWQPPVEINLSEVRLDGRLLIRDPAALAALPAPWSEAREHDEIVLEIKMQGDHVDMRSVERALLRRQARQVQRMEDDEAPWDGDVPIWLVAPHVPAVLSRRRRLEQLAPGCYRVGPAAFSFLWIAANELPLEEGLVPFLVARTGRPLDELGRWIKERRPFDWVSRMVECLPMSAAVHEELLRFVLTKSDDPEIKAKQKLIAKVYVDMTPEVKAEVVAEATERARRDALQEGHLAEARSVLRRVLARRKLVLGAAEDAQIDACGDVATLDRWIDQAVDAASVAEALR